MSDNRGTLIAWSAGVSAVAAAFAGLLASRATTPLSQNPWFIACVVVACATFVMLLGVGLTGLLAWWRSTQARTAEIRAQADQISDVKPQADERARELVPSRDAHQTDRSNISAAALRAGRSWVGALLAVLLVAAAIATVVGIVARSVRVHDQACSIINGEIIWADQVTQEEGNNPEPPSGLVGQAERLAPCGEGQLILIRGAGEGGVQAGPPVSLGQLRNVPSMLRNYEVQQLVARAFQGAETIRVPGAGRDVIGLLATISSELGPGQNTVWLRTLGLPTVNPANVRLLMAADPAQAVASIPGPLPSLHSARVHLVLSPPAGNQPRLNFATDAWRRQFMLGLLRRTGADVVSTSEEETIEHPATGAPSAPIIVNLPYPTPHLPGKPQPHEIYTATLDTSALFQPNSAAFTASERKVLAELQPIIEGWRQGLYSHITVVGHSAKFGTAAAALLLSRQRAATVGQLLRLHGVSAVTFEGVGFDQPLPPNPRNASNRVIIITAYPKN